MSDTGRAIAIAQLIRTHGPARAVELVREADKAHAEGRPPDYGKLLDTGVSEGEGGGDGHG